MEVHPVSAPPRAMDWSPSSQDIHRRMDAVVQQKPELKEAVMFYRSLLPILRAAEAEVQAFPLDAEAVRRKFDAGVPVLVQEELPLDIPVHSRVFSQVCQLIESSPEKDPPTVSLAGESPPDPSTPAARQGETVGHAATRIRRAVEGGELDLAAVWQALAGSRWPEIAPLADRLHLDSILLRRLGEFSLIPALHVWAREAAEQVDVDQWRRGMCPLCGSLPIFSEIQGKEASRRLRCSLCAADWAYPRFQCVSCGNEDYRRIEIIYADGEEEKYRLQACGVCHGYIKKVVTFEPTPFELLVVEDLATLHLDLIASERGFRRAPVLKLV